MPTTHSEPGEAAEASRPNLGPYTLKKHRHPEPSFLYSIRGHQAHPGPSTPGSSSSFAIASICAFLPTVFFGQLL